MKTKANRRRPNSKRAHAEQRRGVLLLVVLSMLVLFLLVGTTFLITSNQYRTASQIVEKSGRATFQPADVLERALMQLLRDTNNRYSVARYHSLLRDMYGGDGLFARVYPVAGQNPVFIQANYDAALMPRYAGAEVGVAGDLGPTNGQLVDFFVREVHRPSSGDARVLEDDNAVGLDLDENGLPIDHELSRIDGYYNGCLFTLLGGPCAGQSVRVIDYEHLSTIPVATPVTASTTTITTVRFRVITPRRADGSALRFGSHPGRSDLITLVDFFENGERGHAFVVNGRPFNGTGFGFNSYADTHGPRLTASEAVRDAGGNPIEYAEVALSPNSVVFDAIRDYAGGGAFPIDSRVNVFTPFVDPSAPENPQFNLLSTGFGDENGTAPVVTTPSLYRIFPGPGGADESYDAADYQNMALALQAAQPRERARVVTSVDANGDGVLDRVDPAAYYPSGASTAPPQRLDLTGLAIPSFHRPALVNYWFHRIMNSTWLQSAIASPSIRALAIIEPYDVNDRDGDGDRTELNPEASGLTVPLAQQITALKRKFLLRPLREDHPNFDGSNAYSRYSTGANPAELADNGVLVNSTSGEITFPYWEVAGPWDVDNDGDSVPDSVWIDMGLPVQQTEDGRLYKPLVAVLIEDLDGRLNLNAHGSNDQLAEVNLDPTSIGNLAQDYDSNPNQPGRQNQPVLRSTDQLAQGSGWGPADVSLRPVLSPWIPVYDSETGAGITGDRQYDDFARLLGGRPDPDQGPSNRAVSQAVDLDEPWGRYGESTQLYTSGPVLGQPGLSTENINGALAAVESTLDPVLDYDFLGAPVLSISGLANQPTAFTSLQNLGRLGAVLFPDAIANLSTIQKQLSIVSLGGYGDPPDFKARYASGLSALGAAVFEADAEFAFNPLSLDTPYELDLSSPSRRGEPADLARVVNSYSSTAPINDDAPFSVAELERILRSYDSDAAKLPDRLWNLVDAFDPDKLAVQNAMASGDINLDSFPNFTPDSLQRVIAQTDAAIRRRQVTTDSWDTPVPNENWGARLLFGADGLPGVPNFDDDGDGIIDEGDEVIASLRTDLQHQHGAQPIQTYAQLRDAGCDDYVVYMLADPPASPRLTDYMRYRITLELVRQGRVTLANTWPAQSDGAATAPDMVDSLINNILSGPGDVPVSQARSSLASFGGLIAPEVIAGLKMNLNRPFGDGRDNNGNGVVDEPQEAGEAWIDANNNGDFDSEFYLDQDGDGRFYADTDANGSFSFNIPGDGFDFDNDGDPEPIVDSLWNERVGSPVKFDHTGGVDANGSGAYLDNNGNGVFDTGDDTIHDDGHMARQLYARHLYCLMLALVDENYLAPYDENDPQVKHYLDPRSGFLDQGNPRRPVAGSSMAYRIAYELAQDPSTPGVEDPAPLDPSLDTNALRNVRIEATRLAMRKLTARKIAQWAINVVDMRDPDSIQTPFEYDENPWDGWNVVDTNNDLDNAGDDNDTTDDNVYPLDGDLATDENDFAVRVINAGGFGSIERVDGAGLAADNDRILVTDQTRGVVWGAERPELLMTEGLALHDRRQTDSALINVSGPGDGDGGSGNGAQFQGGKGGDDDLDQRTLPKGSAFVELYNPWANSPQRPRELYSRQADTAPSGDPVLDPAAPAYAPYRFNPVVGELNRFVPTQGVSLDRLSNGMGFRIEPNRANDADPTMRVNNDGFRQRYDQPGKTTTPLPALASPVWRMICVEEHPETRNAIDNDNPAEAGVAISNGAAPLGSASAADTAPWTYSTRTPGTSLQPGQGVMFPAYASLPGGPNSNSSNTTVVSNGIPPEYRLQPDPDWPEFDRFAQPSADLWSTSTQLTNPAPTSVPDLLLSYFDGTNDATTSLTRLQMPKPDRYIERAFYFIGPPEQNADGGSTNRLQALWKNSRDLSQPGLLLPDLSYEMWDKSLRENTEWLISLDHDPPSLKNTNFDAGKQKARPLDVATVGMELLDVTPGFTPNVDTSNATTGIAINGNRFVVTDRFDADGTPPGGTLPAVDSALRTHSLRLAPILPGRYAVIGTAGAIYQETADQIDNNDNNSGGTFATDYELENRYTITLSRELSADTGSLEGPWGGLPWEQDPRSVRRIELMPDEDPSVHQVIVNRNGSFRDGIRSSEILENNINLTNPNSDLGAYSFSPMIDPVVAIPIEGFSISEPLDGYYVRRSEILQAGGSGATGANPYGIIPTRENPEGEAVPENGDNVVGYDQPFDVLEELINDQVTPNYRTLHLQRLANPLLAWNPMPRRPNGEPTPEHDPSRPVNPYMTVDSMPMDLYAYNGGWKDSPTIPFNEAPLATRERGLDPENQQNTRATVPQGLRDGPALTPRDLWRAFSRSAYSNVAREAENSNLNNNEFVSPYAVELQHSLGFANRGAGALLRDEDVGGAALSGVLPTYDVNGDGITRDLVGAPSVDESNAEVSDDNPYPTLHWPNRPFISEMELLQAPAWSSSRMLTYYSTYNSNLPEQPNPYNGDVLLGLASTGPDITGDGVVNTNDLLAADRLRTNRQRWRNEQAPFGHLLNFFMTASGPAQVVPWSQPSDPGDPAADPPIDPQSANPNIVGVVAYGAPHYYRLLDYVHVPSRFTATDKLMSPQVFGGVTTDLSVSAILPEDPRRGLAAPCNRLDNYREPGRVNLNTVVGRGDAAEPADVWSEVYDGLMHRQQDFSHFVDFNNDNVNDSLLRAGHLGPAWRDVAVSRRGYAQIDFDPAANLLDYDARLLHSDFPTFFANPLRSPNESLNVPLAQMQRHGPDSGWLRAHPLTPGEDGAWSQRGVDDAIIEKSGDGAFDIDGIRDDAGEAGGANDFPLLRDPAGFSTSLPDTMLTNFDRTTDAQSIPTPAFAGASTDPSLNTERNPSLRYQNLTKLANTATTRSGAYAIWITVGYFEVTPAHQDPIIANRYSLSPANPAPTDPAVSDLFYRIYQDGYTIGKELGIETGDTRRARGFYIVDRTLPVAFKPGDDLNVEQAVILRRRIE